MKTKPKAPKKKSLLKKAGYIPGDNNGNARTVGQAGAYGGLSGEEADYLNKMLKKFDYDLDKALDALKAKYGHTGDY